MTNRFLQATVQIMTAQVYHVQAPPCPFAPSQLVMLHPDLTALSASCRSHHKT